MKILIIEDEPSLRELMERSLRKEQHVVETARTYAEAAVTEIERGRHGYEMKLDNGLELTFGSDFRLLDIDD